MYSLKRKAFSTAVLQPVKAWQGHSIRADRRLFTELLGCLTCLYSRVGDHARCKLHISLHVLCMAHCMSPAPLRGTCGTQQGIPTCLSTRTQTKGANRSSVTELLTTHAAHSRLWELFIGPSLKAVRAPLIRPIQSYGNTASLSNPDTWVRKPDRLHLPYNSSPLFFLSSCQNPL